MLEIEIVYGLADRQVLKGMTVAEGTTVREAALQSGLEVEFPELDLQQAPLGIFGKAVKTRLFCAMAIGLRFTVHC